MQAELDKLATVLSEQWRHLRSWVISLDADDDLLDSPSALPDWTIRDLIAHLGLGISGLLQLRTVENASQPVASLAEYIALYSRRADDIHKSTHDAALRHGDDILASVDGLGEESLARLGELQAQAVDGSLLVESAHGTLQLRDYVVTRLLEVVIHADDLDRSLPNVASSPVHARALRVAADELLDIVITRGGWSLEVINPVTWVRLASGRVTVDYSVITTAIRPLWAAGGVPDLGMMLPLL